ncbi:hypothetical protein C8Q70DRAFT_933636 [Cubamyces menziesii]|nr:hypothetical protein C8Q70DRAFT_933636 [Cubamyces menziesii]
MSLRRVGGKGDGGIDLQGWWWLPVECLGQTPTSSADTAGTPPRGRLRVIAQCKNEDKKVLPRYIRELEGTVLRYCSSSLLKQNDTHPAPITRDALVGLFLSTSPFSQTSFLQAYSSPIPLALLHLPEPPTSGDGTDGSDPAAVATHTDAPQDAALQGTIVFNPALGGHTGLLRGMVEPRWERSSDVDEGRPGIWTNGTRIQSWTPENDEDIQEAPVNHTSIREESVKANAHVPSRIMVHKMGRLRRGQRRFSQNFSIVITNNAVSNAIGDNLPSQYVRQEAPEKAYQDGFAAVV